LVVTFAAGLSLGLAVLMKQHAAVFVLGALVLVIADDARAKLRRGAALVLGAITPFAVVCAVLAASGVFGRFWLWAIRYARAYVAEVPWSGALPSLLAGLRTVTVATWGLWLLAAFGLLGLWLAPWRRETRVFLGTFVLASFLTTCP